MKKKALSLGLFALVFLSASFAFFVQQSATGQKKGFDLPNIASKAKSVEFLNAEIEELTEKDSLVRLSFKNHSEKPIIAVGLSSGPMHASSWYSKIGQPDGRFRIIALPSETFTLTVVPESFRKGYQVRLSAVIFDDGTSSGEEKKVRILLKELETYHKKIREGQ